MDQMTNNESIIPRINYDGLQEVERRFDHFVEDCEALERKTNYLLRDLKNLVNQLKKEGLRGALNCYTCKRQYTTFDDIESIELTGECCTCNHVRGEIYEEALYDAHEMEANEIYE